MKFFLIIVHIVFWIVIWVQMLLVLFFFFNLIIADNHNRLSEFLKWLFWVIWYVYFLPIHKYGFSRWQNWVYFYRYGEFTSPDSMQWFCEPTPWLFFMFFFTFLCFFYEWSLRHNYDHFLHFLLMVIATIILTL